MEFLPAVSSERVKWTWLFISGDIGLLCPSSRCSRQQYYWINHSIFFTPFSKMIHTCTTSSVKLWFSWCFYFRLSHSSINTCLQKSHFEFTPCFFRQWSNKASSFCVWFINRRGQSEKRKEPGPLQGPSDFYTWYTAIACDPPTS